MKRHPDIGAEILASMNELQELVPIVRHHHERWDGKGYPDGLEKEAIPFGARILAIADAADAMLSDRPYRPTRNLKEVCEEIKAMSGTQFDPSIIKIFLALAKEKESGFFKNSATAVDLKLQLSEKLKIGTDRRYLKKSMISE